MLATAPRNLRDPLAPALGVVVLLASLILWPGLEQPGRAPREALLLIAPAVVLALALRDARSRPPALLVGLLAVSLAPAVVRTLLVPAPERTAVARDLAVLAGPWLIGLATTLRPEVGPEADARGSLDDWIERSAVLALLLLGLAGLLQGWWGWQGIEQGRAPAATFVNRNVAAQTLVVLLPVGLARLGRGCGALAAWPPGLAAGLGLAFLVATRSRGAWIGAGIGLLVGGLVWWRGRRRLGGDPIPLGPPLVAAGLLALAVAVPARSERQQLPSVGVTLGSLTRLGGGAEGPRPAFWANTLAMALDHPALGVGVGRYAVVYPLYHSARVPTPGFGTELQPDHAHSDPLELAAELGLPAAAAVVAILLGAVALSVRQAGGAASSLALSRAAARAAALSGVLVHGLVSFPLHSPASGLIAWVLVGRAWSTASIPLDPRATRRSRLGLLPLLVLPLALWVASRELSAQRALGAGLREFESSSCAAALSAADEVREWAPWRRREVGIAAMLHFECDKDPERSLTRIEPALAAHPHQLNLLLAAGARRLKARRLEDAERAFLHASEIVPELGRAWLGLAMARWSAGNLAGARSACERAVRAADGYPPAAAYCEGNGLTTPPPAPGS